MVPPLLVKGSAFVPLLHVRNEEMLSNLPRVTQHVSLELGV